MSDYISNLVVFFVVVDPPGLVPLFIALTRGFEERHRRIIALRGTAISFVVLVFFAYFGKVVLETLSIGMPAFRIAGGALLFWIAFEMLFAKRSERKERDTGEALTDEDANDIAVFPLAVPLIAGPGAITSILLLMDDTGGTVAGQVSVLGAAATVDRRGDADPAGRRPGGAAAWPHGDPHGQPGAGHRAGGAGGADGDFRHHRGLSAPLTGIPDYSAWSAGSWRCQGLA